MDIAEVNSWFEFLENSLIPQSLKDQIIPYLEREKQKIVKMPILVGAPSFEEAVKYLKDTKVGLCLYGVASLGEMGIANRELAKKCLEVLGERLLKEKSPTVRKGMIKAIGELGLSYRDIASRTLEVLGSSVDVLASLKTAQKYTVVRWADPESVSIIS